MIQILELFGGVGSPRIALRNIGLPVKSIDYVEIDEKAVRSYNAMFEKDLSHKTQSVVGWNLKPDILIHGSPCQDFSIAGKQKGADKNSGTRSSLMWETLRIIEQMGVWKPRIVIWENVKNVLSKHMIHNFNKYLKKMSSMGYTNSFEVLNAIDFGLPQKRERVFTISFLDGTYFDFEDLIKTEAPHIRELLEDIQEEKYIVTQPSMLKVINSIGNSSFNGRVEVIDDHCKTITTKQMRSPNSGVIDLGDGRYRYLTELECWRLQGYSDEDFYNALRVHPGRENCLNGALYKQAGNSIPVTIFESIFRKIFYGEVEIGEKQLKLDWREEDGII
ncbi:MAG: DNA cytosine methyltransferase [Gudongella sp.]|nr:DNA cytosine methyltransferase [Gudongella sp.]